MLSAQKACQQLVCEKIPQPARHVCCKILQQLLQANNVALSGAITSACADMGLQAVEPFVEKVSVVMADG